MLGELSRRVLHPLWALTEGSGRLRYLQQFEESQWRDQEVLRAEALARLRGVLAHAVARCRYYRRQAETHGLRPEDIRELEDLVRWPMLDKAAVRAHGRELLAEGWPEDDLLPSFTGGSTQAALQVWRHRELVASRAAGMWRHDRWSGWDLGRRRAVLWGSVRDLWARGSWRGRVQQALLSRTLELNGTELGPDTVAEFVTQLQRFRPETMLAFAQHMATFARLAAARGLAPAPLRGIITVAEVLSPDDRSLIESIFDCPVYNRYACREVGVIASQCPERGALHINAESVLVEFVRNGRHVAPGELGEVVVTDLRGLAMPLIRYRLGDVGSPVAGVCRCGRGLPLMAPVSGRVADFIVRADGEPVAGVPLVQEVLAARPAISQLQLLQRAPGEVVAKVAPGERFCDRELEAVRAALAARLGEKMVYRFEVVEAIPLEERSGKYRFAISEVSPAAAFGNDPAGVGG